jgi:hypothetical protein
MITLNYLKHLNLLKIVTILSLISLVFTANQSLQSIYGQTATKSFNIKAEIDKKVVKIGNSQKIKITIVDSSSKQPVSGAQVKATVTYPGGELVRVFSTITDSSGHASISIPINKSTQSDTVNVDLVASLTGFSDTTFTITFAVISKNIN